MDELRPGTELLQGQFTIMQFLNSGGFGITYLAKDSLDRVVVIKECFPSSFCHRSRNIVQARSRSHTVELKTVVGLFVQEARSLAKLDHPNIVGVHQVFEDNQTAYMVLDYVKGRDLLDRIEAGDHGLTPVQIKGLLRDLLAAVQFIHDKDILHRDISPDNILVDANMRPVLIDFGAAREEATKKSRVLSAMRVVKDGYSPQEFYVQGSAQSPSSDLYALAATFYHLIEGDMPPNSQSRLAAIASGDADPYVPLAGRIAGYEAEFLAAIDMALAILPKDRLQSAQDWANMMDGNETVMIQEMPAAVIAAAGAGAPAPWTGLRVMPLFGSVAVVALLAVGGFALASKLTASGVVADATIAPVTTLIKVPAPVQEVPHVETGDLVQAPSISMPSPSPVLQRTAPEGDVLPRSMGMAPSAAPADGARVPLRLGNTPGHGKKPVNVEGGAPLNEGAELSPAVQRAPEAAIVGISAPAAPYAEQLSPAVFRTRSSTAHRSEATIEHTAQNGVWIIHEAIKGTENHNFEVMREGSIRVGTMTQSSDA